MPERQTNRVQYVDRLRGLAVVGMFFVHPAVAWMAPEAKQTPYFMYAMRISGMVAPVFLFLAGVSMAIVSANGSARGRDARDLKRRVYKRGIEILLIGYAFHLVTFVLNGCHGSWTHVLKVDVLQCIGLSLFLFTWMAWPSRPFNPVALLLFAMLPLIGVATYRLPIAEVLPPGVAEYLTVRGKLVQFSFVPYGAWVALGLFVGPLWTASQGVRKREMLFWSGVIVAGVVCFAIGKGLKWVYYDLSLHEVGVTKPQTKGVPYDFWTKATFVLALFALSRVTASLVDRFPKQLLVLFGRTSLFSYCAHLIIVYHVAGPLLPHKLNPAQHLVSSSMLCVAMFLLAYGWHHRREGRWVWSALGRRVDSENR